MALTGKERRQLRGLGHHLSPVVQVGQSGVTKGVISAVHQALEDHELVKVKIGGEAPADRHEVADALAAATKSEIAQILGRTILLFRKRAKKSKFEKLGTAKGPTAAAASASTARKKKQAAAAKPAKRGATKKAPVGLLPEDDDLDDEEPLAGGGLDEDLADE